MNTIDKIILLLNEKKLDQKDLTDYLCIEKSIFSAWKSGKSQSYNKYISEIAKFLECPVDYLISDSIEFDFAPHDMDEAIVKCPLCNYEYVHFDKVLAVDFNNEKSYGVAIQFKCEDDHTFYLVLETYKGNTYMVQTDESGKIDCFKDIAYENSPISLNKLWDEDTDGDLSSREQSIITAYRSQPEMQSAVDRLLGIVDEPVIEHKIAAYGGDNVVQNTDKPKMT